MERKYDTNKIFITRAGFYPALVVNFTLTFICSAIDVCLRYKYYLQSTGIIILQ